MNLATELPPFALKYPFLGSAGDGSTGADFCQICRRRCARSPALAATTIAPAPASLSRATRAVEAAPFASAGAEGTAAALLLAALLLRVLLLLLLRACRPPGGRCASCSRDRPWGVGASRRGPLLVAAAAAAAEEAAGLCAGCAAAAAAGALPVGPEGC